MLRNSSAVDPVAFANSARALLDEDWRRYRQFGAYWFFVKAILKRVFDRHQMPILGDYEDPSVVARMPANGGANAVLEAAIAEFQHNGTFNPCSSRVEDDDGEFFTLLDTDVEG